MSDDRGTVLAEALGDLAGIDLLADVPPDRLWELAGLLRPVTASSGAALLRRGAVAEDFLLLTAGSVAVEIGDGDAGNVLRVRPGSLLGEIALLRGGRHSATVTALTDVRGLAGGVGAFARMLALPGVRERVVHRARHRLAANLRPVPVTLREGAVVGLRPVLPDDGPRLLQARSIASAETIYMRFFAATQPTPETARMLTDVDYVDHFAWVGVGPYGEAVGGVSYVRLVDDPDEADISFSIMDAYQGRGLGSLFMGAIAVAARRNRLTRFSADVLSENWPMRAILGRACIRWGSGEYGVVHGVMGVPDPARFGIDPTTAAALDAIVAEVCLRAAQSPLVVAADVLTQDGVG